ncbi:MAG TPA: cytidylate kinase-like family protein [Chloroflexota bacterium]|jgi:cytidylate kinase
MAVITFSREAHSGTQDLARLLAQRLGYRYVGRDELTEAVTARSGVSREPQTGESEGRSLSLWEHLGEQLTGDREAYVTALKAVITELALADNVVIVGHGAGLFLNEMRSVVRVFVVAPMADRLARLHADGVDDPARARNLIDQQDRESAAYLRYLFGVDWLDPHQWDLVINTGRADPEAALDMLTQYTRSLVRDRLEHADLERKQVINRVEQALIGADLGIDKLGVHFDGETLTLQGEALTQDDRARTEALARSVASHVTLDNQIVLRPPSSA